ncbi:hypothetical protein B0H14DRAFT_2837998 [Mycena olivaceomarginata]|nr:hypothetical protein B0H14DRAFT_2837998 [Mycena olivaceomarginata]
MPALKTRDSNVPGAYVRITRTKQRKEPEGQVVGSRRSLARVPFTFAVSDGSSSLQILASALEKLRAPPPDRPNTAVRFKSLPRRSPIIVSQSIMGSSVNAGQAEENGLEDLDESRRAAMAARNLWKSVLCSSSAPGGPGHNLRRSTRVATTLVKTPIHNFIPLSILTGCTVYVDIVSESGDSAKLLIMDMLKQLGARVLGSVGQTLTHIVYKNGRPGTVAHYQALPEPKPAVVGMEWVVRSAETGAHAVETPYLIHIDDMTNTAVKPSRRMRMWSVPALKEVPPLEMARLRKKELPDA